MTDPKKAKKGKKKFTAENKNPDSPRADIVDACAGLFFISETDAEFEAFVAGVVRSSATNAIIETLGIDDPNIEEVSFDDFFSRLTSEKDWHGPREKKRREQFAKLRSALQNHLQHLRVIRVGRIWIDIYVAGIDAQGRVAGVKTRSLET